MFKLPGYEISEHVHSGRRSCVYRGIRLKDKLPVILKFPRNDFPTDDDIVRLRREFEIGGGINDPHVVKYHAIEKYQHGLVLVVEDFHGMSLAGLLPRVDFDMTFFLNMTIQLAEALTAIHRAHVIHKDVKPGNIIMNRETGQVKIGDFGIASRVHEESPEPVTPNRLEGTLTFMSPEQTGRMNRTVDYRTDFYSLGVSLYQLLTHRLPFDSKDPMELIHSHIAKHAAPPHELDLEIPLSISEVIMKLLEKNAEDRYKSGQGLKADLERCLELWDMGDTASTFKLGAEDYSEKFLMPQNLYGREREVETLMAAFHRVVEGGIEVLLVSGYGGVGKSSLILEIRGPVTKERGYFAYGRFQQLYREIAYSAITWAFQDLVKQILGESEERLQMWRGDLLSALGKNGQIMIDLIPELERIIGPQPAVREVSPDESKNRFQRVFQNFVSALAKMNHVLVLFLDDLQWADPASIKLMESLLSDKKIGNLLFIGSYRDNKVKSDHLLVKTASNIRKAGVTVNHISVKPLCVENVNQLIADALHCTPQKSERLAKLVYRKTEGNPFFVKAFLRSLYEDKYLVYSDDQGWRWDVNAVTGLQAADNVAEFMADRITLLPPKTQDVLKIGAGLGMSFDLNNLSEVIEKPVERLFIDLMPAQNAGMIIHQSGTKMGFAHSRVREAAYSLVPDGDKSQLHLTIGRLLLEGVQPEARVKKIFDIIDHLNKGLDLIADDGERTRLAELNLEAAMKAKKSAAYVSARRYISSAMTCLIGDFWNTHHDLALTLHKERALLEYLSGNPEGAETFIDLVLAHADADHERAAIHELRIIRDVLAMNYDQAIENGRKALAILKVELPEKNLDTALTKAFKEISGRIDPRYVEALLEREEMSRPEHRVALMLLRSMQSAAILSDHHTLFFLISMKIVELSLQHGNIPESAAGYATYGLYLSSEMGEPEVGFRFGLLALNLCDRFHDSSQKCRTSFLLGNTLGHWSKPLSWVCDILEAGHQAGLESGEMEYAGYNLSHFLLTSYHKGERLEQLLKAIPRAQLFCRKTKNRMPRDLTQGLRIILYNLTGRTETLELFYDGDSHDAAFLERCQEMNDHYSAGRFLVLKLQALYLYGKAAQGLQLIDEMAPLLPYIRDTFAKVEYIFYHSLCLLALYPERSESGRKRSWEQLELNQRKMEKWAENCPKNMRHKFLLIQAEMARHGNCGWEPLEIYDEAIELAQENGFLQDEALINECTANFWLARDKDKIAQPYMGQAYYGYQRWGARRKAAMLLENHPNLIRSGPISPRGATWSTTATLSIRDAEGVQGLDLMTVIRSSLAISSEMNLDKLLTKIMSIVIANAGAQTGLLLDKQGDEIVIEAAATADADCTNIVPSLGGNHAEQEYIYARSIVNYVIRTGETVVLHDAVSQGPFTNDAYVIRHRPKSILAVPIPRKDGVPSVLYLENDITTKAFTPERLDVLRIIIAQATISLDNARLYSKTGSLNDALRKEVQERQIAEAEVRELNRNLELRVKERTAQLEAAQKKIVERAHQAGMTDIACSVLHNVGNTLNSVLVSGQLIKDTVDRTKLSNLFKANNLLTLNMENLERFILEDQRGPKLMKYYLAIGDMLQEEHEQLLQNVNHLLERVDAVRNVIAAQETFVSGQLFTEKMSLTEIVEDALNIEHVEIGLNEITIEKCFDHVPLINVHRNKLVHVVLNLLKNARQALDNMSSSNKKITIAIQGDQEHAYIRVADTGCGLEKAYLKKIFTHGFSTKTSGYGFSLHSCANYMTEMGGTMWAESSGLGQGATFILKFPIDENDRLQAGDPPPVGSGG